MQGMVVMVFYCGFAPRVRSAWWVPASPHPDTALTEAARDAQDPPSEVPQGVILPPLVTMVTEHPRNPPLVTNPDVNSTRSDAKSLYSIVSSHTGRSVADVATSVLESPQLHTPGKQMLSNNTTERERNTTFEKADGSPSEEHMESERPKKEKKKKRAIKDDEKSEKHTETERSEKNRKKKKSAKDDNIPGEKMESERSKKEKRKKKRSEREENETENSKKDKKKKKKDRDDGSFKKSRKKDSNISENGKKSRKSHNESNDGVE